MARILLAEDEMLVRELAYEDLSGAGHQVVATGTGDEALAIMRKDRGFDVLFTDIRMPGSVDGWQLASEGKLLIPGLKVVFATGLGDDSEHLPTGDRMLTKPYRKSELLGALQ